MPEKRKATRVQKARSPSTQAGEYVHEEIEHVRAGKHGARSARQAIAIGLSKARRAGVKLPPPPGKKAPKATSIERFRARCAEARSSGGAHACGRLHRRLRAPRARQAGFNALA